VSTRPERLRLFVAVDVPRRVLEELERAAAPLREKAAGARWAPVDNGHITLKFLGSVDALQLEDVVKACRAAARELDPGEIRVSGIGVFPSARRARVLWAGVEEETGVLSSAASSLERELSSLGYGQEKRSFTPHLTLARFRTPTDARALVEGTAYRSEPIEVEHFHLYRSRLSPKGARYEVLASFVLEGEARRKK
jgi:RNA 2',3'-cyclic 3'-phosphodiesterase